MSERKQEIMNNNKQLLFNLIVNILAFTINIGVNFFLTPFIVTQLGDEAYGYIGLSNNIISFANLLALAINSMAGRFIGIKIYKEDEAAANIYFNSVFISNCIITLFVSVLSVFMIINLTELINVSPHLLKDVQITLSLLFINFIINTLTSIFNIAAFVKNRLDLQSVRRIWSYIINLAIVIVLFRFFSTKIYYIAIATLCSSVFLAISNCRLSRKLLPQLKVNIHKFDIKAVKELLGSGIWNSLNSLSNILLTGIDLLIANLFITPEAMGILAIAKTVPNAIRTLTGTISEIFTPNYLKIYAQGDYRKLINEVNHSIKILSFLTIVPLGGFIVFGTEFYSLWLPDKSIDEIKLIQTLSILTVLPTLFNAFIEGIYGINRVTNKIKTSVIVTTAISILSIILVFLLLRMTNGGVYVIAGVSSILMTFRVLLFAPMYATHILDTKLSTFYPSLLKSILCLTITIGVFYTLRTFIVINSWSSLLLGASFIGALGYLLNFIFVFSKNERVYIKNNIMTKFKRGN